MPKCSAGSTSFHRRDQADDHGPPHLRRALADTPLSETRACHYESSGTGNFLIDRHPDFANVWIAGGGSAEGFKFGPVVGDYVAGRILDRNDEPELAEGFSIPLEEPVS